MSPLWNTAKQKILTPLSLGSIFLLALFYIILAGLFLNYHLVWSTLIGTFPISYKTTLLLQLITGIFTAIGPQDSILLVLNGLFFGLNILLIIKTLHTLDGMGKIKLSVGGATLIGLVVAGCGACGFTVFSLLGLTISFSFLPLHGLEMHILSLLVLIFSSWYMIRKLTNAQLCSLY